MKPTPLRFAPVAGAGFLALWLASCSGSTDSSQARDVDEAASGLAAADPAASEPAVSSESTGTRKVAELGKPSRKKAAGGTGLTLDGEHFTVRKVIDQQQGGLPVAVFVAPETWRDQSQVTWNYANTSNPVTTATSVENPANAEAFYLYPVLSLFWLRPGGYFTPGQNVGGQIYVQPMRPEATLLAFVQQARGQFPGFKMLGTKDLPGLPEALKLSPSPGQRGVGLKVRYDLNGRPIEEEFYAVQFSVDVPYDGPQGRTWQTNWGLRALHSFRAPLGALDKRRPVFAAIARSFRPNPAWQQRFNAINAYLTEQFNRQLQAGYDQIAAAGRLSRQISANNDAMLASIDSRLQAARSSSSTRESASARSSAEKFDDYIRGVDTTDDPYYGTSQHSNTESYHWTDGYGTYRNSNDANYNPNQVESGNWQLMPSTR